MYDNMKVPSNVKICSWMCHDVDLIGWSDDIKIQYV